MGTLLAFLAHQFPPGWENDLRVGWEQDLCVEAVDGCPCDLYPCGGVSISSIVDECPFHGSSSPMPITDGGWTQHTAERCPYIDPKVEQSENDKRIKAAIRQDLRDKEEFDITNMLAGDTTLNGLFGSKLGREVVAEASREIFSKMGYPTRGWPL